MELTYKHTNERMSQIVIADKTVYLAGQLPEPGSEPDLKAQAQYILEKIDRLLAEAGTSKDRIMLASIYLADMDDFNAFNEVWEAWVAKGRTPARVCLESRLARPEWRVEVAIVAAQA